MMAEPLSEAQRHLLQTEAAWRKETELLRSLAGREGEDVGPRRIVADLQAEAAMLREALEDAKAELEGIPEVELPGEIEDSINTAAGYLEAALSSTAGAEYLKRVGEMETLLHDWLALAMRMSDGRGYVAPLVDRTRVLIEKGKS